MLLNFCFSPVNLSCFSSVIRRAKEPGREEGKTFVSLQRQTSQDKREV